MTFDGFTTPTKNYFPMPNIWIDICAEINNLAELKVIQYVLRHTWGYKEYGIKKAITTDEFMHGRKRTDGSRIDKGTGLSNRSVIDGLRAAINHGYLEYELDEADKARKVKSYALKMAQSDVKILHIETAESDVKKVHIGCEESSYPGEVSSHLPEDTSHRSEKDTLERNLEKETKEKDSDVNADALTRTQTENNNQSQLSTNETTSQHDIHTDQASTDIPIATTTPQTELIGVATRNTDSLPEVTQAVAAPQKPTKNTSKRGSKRKQDLEAIAPLPPPEKPSLDAPWNVLTCMALADYYRGYTLTNGSYGKALAEATKLIQRGKTYRQVDATYRYMTGTEKKEDGSGLFDEYWHDKTVDIWHVNTHIDAKLKEIREKRQPSQTQENGQKPRASALVSEEQAKKNKERLFANAAAKGYKPTSKVVGE